MKLKLKSQDFQTNVVNAVADLFAGQKIYIIPFLLPIIYICLWTTLVLGMFGEFTTIRNWRWNGRIAAEYVAGITYERIITSEKARELVKT